MTISFLHFIKVIVAVKALERSLGDMHSSAKSKSKNEFEFYTRFLKRV